MGLNLTKFQKPATRPELLLQPNIPKPLHGIAPRTILGEPWWEATKEQALQLWQKTCAVCGVDQAHAPESPSLKFHHLECHEVYKYDYKAGTLTYTETVPLCFFCHAYIHSGRSEVLVRKGELSKMTFLSIQARGDDIIKRAGLKKLVTTAGAHSPAWQDWRMIINGKAHRGKFASYSEWMKFYNVPAIPDLSMYSDGDEEMLMDDFMGMGAW